MEYCVDSENTASALKESSDRLLILKMGFYISLEVRIIFSPGIRQKPKQPQGI